jgi:hypothetical protein
MSSNKITPNMAVAVLQATTLIQNAWRSYQNVLMAHSSGEKMKRGPSRLYEFRSGCNDDDYRCECDDEDEPVYDEQRRLLGYVDSQEMEWLADPCYAKWVLDDEIGPRDHLIDQVARERLGRHYKSETTSIPPMPPPLTLQNTDTLSQYCEGTTYDVEDDVECGCDMSDHCPGCETGCDNDDAHRDDDGDYFPECAWSDYKDADLADLTRDAESQRQVEKQRMLERTNHIAKLKPDAVLHVGSTSRVKERWSTIGQQTHSFEQVHSDTLLCRLCGYCKGAKNWRGQSIHSL